jgi:hypothetical protein
MQCLRYPLFAITLTIAYRAMEVIRATFTACGISTGVFTMNLFYLGKSMIVAS